MHVDAELPLLLRLPKLTPSRSLDLHVPRGPVVRALCTPPRIGCGTASFCEGRDIAVGSPPRTDGIPPEGPCCQTRYGRPPPAPALPGTASRTAIGIVVACAGPDAPLHTVVGIAGIPPEGRGFLRHRGHALCARAPLGTAPRIAFGTALAAACHRAADHNAARTGGVLPRGLCSSRGVLAPPRTAARTASRIAAPGAGRAAAANTSACTGEASLEDLGSSPPDRLPCSFPVRCGIPPRTFARTGAAALRPADSGGTPAGTSRADAGDRRCRTRAQKQPKGGRGRGRGALLAVLLLWRSP